MSLYNSIIIIVNTLLIVLVGIFVIWFFTELRKRKLSNRILSYTITTDNNNSLFDIINDIFIKLRLSLNKLLSKSTLLKKYSLKYQKYIDKSKKGMHDPMDYVSCKFLLSILAIIILIISDTLQGEIVNFLQIVIAFAIGFYSLDIFLISKKKIIQKRMENDLLKAITIMNNSFRSGRSIIQTIKIVCQEIDGPLQEEFEKMYHDLEYGLEIETVFERFNNRVNLKDVKYITTSLTILNKTGGNIIEVFSSIEKTVFSNKKLEEELYNLSASSKVLYRILSVVPIIFIGLIYVLDPNYFTPLFSNSLGILILIFIIIIYIAYILIVKKIIKLKEY